MKKFFYITYKNKQNSNNISSFLFSSGDISKKYAKYMDLYMFLYNKNFKEIYTVPIVHSYG